MRGGHMMKSAPMLLNAEIIKNEIIQWAYKTLLMRGDLIT